MYAANASISKPMITHNTIRAVSKIFFFGVAVLVAVSAISKAQ